MLNDILTRTPVNKLSAIVTSQSGCSDDMALDDERDSLVRALQQIDREIAGLPKKHRFRAELGQKKEGIKKELIRVNRLLGNEKRKRLELQHYIVLECKRRFTVGQWNSILAAAREAKANDR